MVKNKVLPDSARPCCTPRLVTSLSLPCRLGPIKAGLMCLLSLSLTPFILGVPPGSCWGWTPAGIRVHVKREGSMKMIWPDIAYFEI